MSSAKFFNQFWSIMTLCLIVVKDLYKTNGLIIREFKSCSFYLLQILKSSIKKSKDISVSTLRACDIKKLEVLKLVSFIIIKTSLCMVIRISHFFLQNVWFVGDWWLTLINCGFSLLTLLWMLFSFVLLKRINRSDFIISL